MSKKNKILSTSSEQLELHFNPIHELDSKIVFKGDADFFKKENQKRNNEKIKEYIINSVKDLGW